MATGARNDRRRFLSEINVTPFVDVMLVLLIIFMVTAPMMQEGMDVNLPKVESAPLTGSDDPLVITVDRNRRVYVGGAPVRLDELRGKLSAIKSINQKRSVLLKADEGVPYGAVVETMAEIRASGVTRIGLATEPAERP